MKKGKEEKMNKTAAGFSATQVGTMLEGIHKEIKIVAEGHTDLDRRIERLEVEVHGNSNRLEMLEITSRMTTDKVSHLENAISKLGKDLRAEIAETKKELKAEIAETKAELKKDIHELGNRLTSIESSR